MKIKNLFLTVLMSLFLSFTACDDDDKKPESDCNVTLDMTLPEGGLSAGEETIECVDEPCAGTEVVEAGTETVEAGTETVEAGTETVEAGTETVEAGTETVEAGTETVEAGTETVEAGTEPVEAGTEPEGGSTDPLPEGGAEGGQQDAPVPG